jgi:hypothetical protein
MRPSTIARKLASRFDRPGYPLLARFFDWLTGRLVECGR